MCKIQDCDNQVLARGWCRKHYLRWYKTGNPEGKIKQKITKGEDHPNYKHGNCGHYLYKTWSNMISRCENKKDHAYKMYGGRGISVCEDWRGPEGLMQFIKDMGDRPEKHSLDRINSDGHYEPSNCRWADDKTQARNRRFCKLTFDKVSEIRNIKRKGKNGRGSGETLQSIADKYGVSRATIKKVVSGEYWS